MFWSVIEYKKTRIYRSLVGSLCKNTDRLVTGENRENSSLIVRLWMISSDFSWLWLFWTETLWFSILKCSTRNWERIFEQIIDVLILEASWYYILTLTGVYVVFCKWTDMVSITFYRQHVWYVYAMLSMCCEWGFAYRHILALMSFYFIFERRIHCITFGRMFNHYFDVKITIVTVL